MTLISPEVILPSQDYLKPDTVKYIRTCIADGAFDKLPPIPMVREDDRGNLIAIDGHNLIAVRLYRNEKVDVHVARHADDGLPPSSDANIQRNDDLHNKFEAVVAERERIAAGGIVGFRDLIDRYDDLFHEEVGVPGCFNE